MKHIYKKGRLDETETRKYMRQIVSAVDHLHKAGIIHRCVCVCVCVGGGGACMRVFMCVTEKKSVLRQLPVCESAT